MKRYAFKTVVFILFLFIMSIAMITAIKVSQRDTQFRTTQIGLKAMVQIQASALNDGYFSWSEVRNLVEGNRIPDAQSLLDDALEIYPFVNEIKLQRGSPPLDDFDISSNDTSLNLSFSLKDDFGFNPLTGWKGVVTMNAQGLLDALQSENKLVIAPADGHDLMYSLKADFEKPLLDWRDYLLVIILTMAIGYSVSVWLWRKDLIFY